VIMTRKFQSEALPPSARAGLASAACDIGAHFDFLASATARLNLTKIRYRYPCERQ
jgi:hypothetical protein